MVQLEKSKLNKKLESTIRKACYDFSLITTNQTIGLALSGGKDSLTLLHLLYQISGRGFPPFKIHAFYVSGQYSCGPSITEKFLKAHCDKLKIELSILKQKDNTLPSNCYSCSRVRRTLLFNAAKEQGIDTIAFGHHKDDSNETLLMNLLHKGEFASMLPKIKMKKYNTTIIRPMIYIHEKEIISFAEENEFLRFTCQCPIGQTSDRNNMKKIITQLESNYSNVRNNLARASMLYGSDKALKN